MSYHTPGPWVVAKYSKKRFGLGTRGCGAVFYLQCVHDDADSPAAIADARLIAAAPELLRACRAIASAELPPIPEPDADGYYPAIEFGRISMMHKMQAMAREAVAKATGGPHGRGDGVD